MARKWKLLLLAALLLLSTANACSDDGEDGDGDGDGGEEADGGEENDGNTKGASSAENQQSAEGEVPEEEEPQENEIEEAVKEKGLEDLDSYDESAYKANEKLVEDGSELQCNFDGPCCWGNDRNGQDEFQWVLAKKVGDPAKFEGAFEAPPPDSPPVLVAIGGEAESELWSARFVSCTVGCSDDFVDVTVDYWTTGDVVLEVCQQAAFSDSRAANPLTHCIQLPKAASPGPVTAKLPPGELFDIVIVARNFVGEKDVGLAVIDNIDVSFAPCEEEEKDTEENKEDSNEQEPEPTTTAPVTDAPTEPPTTTAADGDGDLCPLVECMADDGTCEWDDSKDNDASLLASLASQGMESVTGRYKNMVTGIRSGPDDDMGNPYLATYLFPGDIAAMESKPLMFNEDRVLRFRHYEATWDMFGQICLDGPDNCPFETDVLADPSERQWLTQSVLIPKGTEKLFLVLRNEGTNQGAFGIDDIQLLKPSGPDPEDADESACIPR